ncbi:hypothetical protein ACWJKU_08745 [Methylocaldum sp. MU1018]
MDQSLGHRTISLNPAVGNGLKNPKPSPRPSPKGRGRFEGRERGWGEGIRRLTRHGGRFGDSTAVFRISKAWPHALAYPNVSPSISRGERRFIPVSVFTPLRRQIILRRYHIVFLVKFGEFYRFETCFGE